MVLHPVISRTSRWLTLIVATTMSLVASTGVSAHRRDEYLQAARIGVQLDGISIDLDLTPGIEVAPSIIAMIDSDGSASLSPDEQHAYATRVVQELRISLDGARVAPRLASATFPELPAFHRGEGTIRLQIRAAHPALTTGTHTLLFRNGHLRGESVYLANALVPQSDGLSVKAQRRDRDQSELTIEYAAGGDSAASLVQWLLVCAPFAALIVLRFTRRSRRTR